jgi:hypothetical protein
MKVRSNDNVEITLSGRELDLIKNCLNEVLGGFKIPDFKSVIGKTERDVAAKLLDQILAVYPPPSKVFPLSKVVTTLIRTVQAD